jgi:hypothetical protein
MAEFRNDEKQRLRETVVGIIDGKKMKEHRVVKHRWNFEPPKALEMTRQDGTITAKGRFTHYLRFVRDDVVTYTFTIGRGQVKDVEVNYEDRGWSEAVNAVMRIAGRYFRIDTTSLEELNTELGKNFGGGVDEEAQVIVANLAMALKLKEQRR